MFGKVGDSSFTKQVRVLIRAIQDKTSVQDSLFEQAILYFQTAAKQKATIAALEADLEKAKDALNAASKKSLAQAQDRVTRADKALKREKDVQREQAQIRHAAVDDLLTKVIRASEGANWQDTQANSAKLLGTIFLLSPGDGPKLQSLHQKLKPLYKAVLAARLLDKLIKDREPMPRFVTDHYRQDHRYSEEDKPLSEFQEMVLKPVLFAAIFQDVGLFHPDARKILKGEDGTLSEFRLLENEERLKLLKLNHQHSLDYTVNALGLPPYVGNSKEEREEHILKYKKRLAFTLELLKDAVKIKTGIGNVLKAPQIYSSVILSTKGRYDKEDATKATLLLQKVAEAGTISKQASDAMVSIVGHFPQGYGVTYIPLDDRGQDSDRYEYGIVNGLNPSDAKIPQVRVVTRNLTFNSSGKNAYISMHNNLHYPTARKKLSRLSEDRLQEIMTTLYANYQGDVKLDLLPKFWHPHGYFSYQAYQNLWNRSTATTN